MADIGAYNLGYQVFKGVVMLALIVNSYFLPFVSRHISDGPRMRDYLSRKRSRIFLVGVFCIALLFLVTPYIFNFYGEGYRDSAAVLRILLVGTVPILHTAFYVPILNSLQRYRFHQTVNVFHVVLNLLLDMLLVPVMGLLGAAVATTIAYFCQAVTFEIYFRIRLRKLFWQ
jgi:O-antigen/teichoic acid export membrane protein